MKTNVTRSEPKICKSKLLFFYVKNRAILKKHKHIYCRN